MNRRQLFLSLASFTLLGTTSTATIATEWNGQSFFSGDWSDAGNWALCSGLAGCEGPESDDTADFGPLGARVTTNVDYARSIKGIKYEIGARLYSISGERLTIGSSGIKNWSNEDQVINNNITLSANQSWGQVLPTSLGTNGEMQIGGSVNLNGKSLTIGTSEARDTLGFLIPRTFVRLDKGFTGSGNVYAGGTILEGASTFSGNIYLGNGGSMIVRGGSARIDAGSSAAPDVRFQSDISLVQRRWGVLRVDNGAYAKVDRVTATNDYNGKVYIGTDSEVYVGVDGSDFTMNTLIQGEGVHNNSRLFKDGGGVATINTYSFDADGFYGAGGVKTIVRDGTLKLTGDHANNNVFETQSGGKLDLDVADGLTRTVTHSISGSGAVGKSGRGTAVLGSALAFSGDFHMDDGRLNLGRDDAFSGDNVLRLNDGIFDLNGKRVAFARVLPVFGDIDFHGGELTVGKLDESHGNSSLRVIDHLGSGTLVKTGLDSMTFTFQSGFNGKVKVDQGTLNLFGSSAGIDMEMTGGRLEQYSGSQIFKTAETQAGSVLDLNPGTLTTIGRSGVDAGVASRLGGELLGTGVLVKTGIEDLVVEDADAFDGTLRVSQGTLVLDDTATNASSTIDIRGDGNLALGQGTVVNPVIASAIVGDGTLTKNEWTSATVDNAIGFNGSIVVNRGKLSTGNSTSFGEQVDVHVVRGSIGGGIFTDPLETQLDVNAAQGFGRLTGNGIVDFSSAISVGNGDKSGTFDGTLRSAGGASVTKKGSGRIVLDGDQDYRGTTYVQAGELQINGKLHETTGTSPGISAVQVTNAAGDARLSGSGQVGQVSGNGIVAPGQGRGILTAHSIFVSGGIDFEFEFTGLAPNYGDADNSINDLVRMTDFASLSGVLSANNVISLYMDIGAPLDGASVDGGFFSRRFLSPLFLDDASYQVFVADTLGTELYGGKSYAALDMDYWDLGIEQVFLNRRFEGDSINTSGYVTRFSFTDMTPTTVPLPAGAWLLVSALVALGAGMRRRSTV